MMVVTFSNYNIKIGYPEATLHLDSRAYDKNAGHQCLWCHALDLGAVHCPLAGGKKAGAFR